MIHAMIMAGGKGTRFWPLSRKDCPKQFLSIVDGKSLIESTIDRLKPLTKPATRWIIANATNANYLKRIKSVPAKNILLEPVGRNTAPCIGWGALEALKADKNAIMLVMPADHFISNEKAFVKTIESAYKFLQENNKLLTIGVSPTSPHTGYGYIEVESENAISPIKQFREKPNLPTAMDYLERGTFYWNSGIFMWRADKIIELLDKYMATDMAILRKIMGLKSHSTKTLLPLYKQLTNDSIDYAILEKCPEEIVCMKANFPWSDIGSWTALREFWPKDTHENSTNGKKAILLNSHRNMIYSQKRTVTLIDTDDYLVIDTDDALLIAPQSSDQRIKELVQLLPDHLE